MVGRKLMRAKGEAFDVDTILVSTSLLAEKRMAAGMQISAADRFVIAAPRALIAASAERLSFEQIKIKLEDVRHRLVAGHTRF